jgi:hypothetical protein
MGYRDQRRRRDEALFIAANCKTMAAFTLQAGYPIVAYLLGIAELDVTLAVPLLETDPTLGKSA